MEALEARQRNQDSQDPPHPHMEDTSSPDWMQRKLPWNPNDSSFPQEFRDELDRFNAQNSLEIEMVTREMALAAAIEQLKHNFVRDEWNRKQTRDYHFMHQLLNNGIDDTRKRAVPAYTFTNFSQLPVELRIRIWSFAARAADPVVHEIRALKDEERPRTYYDDNEDLNLTGLEILLEGSSIIKKEYPYGSKPPPKIVLDRVCHESRTVAMGVYTKFYTAGGNRSQRRSWQYRNTLYDEFYLGQRPWHHFKILVDLLIQRKRTTREISTHVQDDIARFKKIRFLKVDFTIFGAVPASIWVEFPKLEKLTIVIYPHVEVRERDFVESHQELDFVKPQRGERHGRRAAWVLSHARTVLVEVAEAELSTWRIPELEVLVRKTGREDDDEGVVEWWTDDMVEWKRAECWDESDCDEQDDLDSPVEDDEWLQQARNAIVHQVTDEKITELKHFYLPSRRFGYDFLFGPDRDWPPMRTSGGRRAEGDWEEDSETEGAEDLSRRPYIWTHEKAPDGPKVPMVLATSLIPELSGQ